MKKMLDNLPKWTFDLDEVSAGVYRVIATHAVGCRIEIKGPDPDDLLERAAADAERMEADMKCRKGPQ